MVPHQEKDRSPRVIKIAARMLAIFSFIARLLRRFGIWCLVYLGLVGSCLRQWWVSLLAGKVTLVVFAMELFGRLFLLAWCGASGRRGIIDALKTLSVLSPTSSFSFSEPYLIGSRFGETILFLFWIYLTFVIFVLDLLSLVYSLCAWVSLVLLSIKSYYLSKKKLMRGYMFIFLKANKLHVVTYI